MFNFKKLLSSLVEKVKSYTPKSKSKKESEKIIEQLEKQNELLQKQIEKQNKTLEAFVEQQRKQSNLFEELQKQNISLTQEIKEIKENKKPKEQEQEQDKEKENKKSITEKEKYKEKYKEKTELLRYTQRKQKKIEESLKDFSIKELKELIKEQLEDLILGWAGNGSSYLVYLNDALAKFNELTTGTEENYEDFIKHVAKYYESLDVSSINSDYVDRLTSSIFNYGYVGTNSDFIQDETVSTVSEIINKL